MEIIDYISTHTGPEIDEGVAKALSLEFMTEPSASNKIATSADLPAFTPTIAAIAALLKGDGDGNAVAAVPDVDYQTPLPFIHAPGAQNRVLTELDAAHDIIYATTAPIDGTTDADKIGQLYCHQKGADNMDFYVCLDDTAKTWRKLASVGPKVTSEILTNSTTWTAPESHNQAFEVTVVGGGGGGFSAVQGGGSGASLQKGTFTIPKGTTVSVTIGTGGAAGSNGGTSSFGSYLSAYGGNTPSGRAGANARSTDGMGGGGGGAQYANVDGAAGGSGGRYGGGGGGAGTYSGYHGGTGGAGGTYGGGGGAGSGAAGSAGGSGGTYGGNGGGRLSNGSDGTNTIGLGLDFEGTGTGGSGNSSAGGAGGGGGGYGGNGGQGGSGTSYAGGSGGGGGGYGGNGGAGGKGGSGTNQLSGGGGGGGYGGNGKDGSQNTSSSSSNYYGGGGGGYGASDYGAGGNGGAAGNKGVVIVSRREIVFTLYGEVAQ